MSTEEELKAQLARQKFVKAEVARLKKEFFEKHGSVKGRNYIKFAYGIKDEEIRKAFVHDIGGGESRRIELESDVDRIMRDD